NAKDALKQLKQAATIPLLKAHYLVRKAELHWLCGELSAAARSADQAETIARDLILPLVEADVGTVRAKILRTKGQAKAAEHEAFRAYQSASRSGLNAHARRILKEFHLESESRQRTQGAGYSTAASPHSMTGMVDPNARRKLDALLALSLASVGARSPEDQARIALDQIVKVLGAERALLLLENPLSKELRVTAGRDEQGNDLSEAGAYSRTMIESVRASQQARVMSADEQGEVSVSKSMIAHQLRSLMAAPLMVQDRLIGVVYLDSRVAKGIFGPDDVEILQAMSNHIAIAIETARATEVELERRELAKDLELTGAVQKLLMPKSNSARTATVAMEAFFQPASQSGGDWWWCDPQRDGRITAIFGDVTGHGAASAMVTAAVTSGYRLLSAAGGNDLGNLISELNVHLRRLCSGEFLMTLSAVELDPAEGVIRWWAAGAPPIMIDRKSGKAELLMAQSTPLGAQDFQFKMEEVPISKGDRVFVFTDGAYEITLASGRQLGFKKLMSIFSETHGRGLEDSRQYLVSELKKNQFKAQQEDDITFALFDIL
ncbi:MAG: PP2C family protein-serine/threonine phosphatase, partial [Bdellovibrionota bacterium]